jgi:hypothetical protein
MRRVLRLVLWCLAASLLVPLLFSVLALYHGSLEMFPTEEQQEKARLFWGAALVFFAALEAGVAAVLWASRDTRRTRP